MTIKKSKRQTLIYVTMALWAGLGVLGAYNGASFSALAAYFASLTGFIITYVWGESVRKSESGSIWKFKDVSTRQVIIYVTLLMWSVLGVVGVLRKSDMTELAVYFTALTPFMGSYILGSSYRKTDAVSTSPGSPS